MITTFLATSMLLSPAAAQEKLDGSTIISKMLAKYAESANVSGEIVMTQSAQGKTLKVVTKLATEKPNKVYLNQSSETVDPRNWLVTCDGGKVSYDSPWKPGSVFQRERIVEPTAFMDQGQPKVMRLNDIFVATKRSLGDAINPFLEVSMQSAESNTSIKAFVSRLKSVKAGAEKALEDGTVVVPVSGLIQFGAKDVANSGIGAKEEFNVIGKFEMLITKDFDLRQVKINESMAIQVPDSNLPVQVNITTIWAGKLDTTTKPDPKLFEAK